VKEREEKRERERERKKEGEDYKGDRGEKRRMFLLNNRIISPARGRIHQRPAPAPMNQTDRRPGRT